MKSGRCCKKLDVQKALTKSPNWKCEHCRIQVYDAKKSQKGVSTPSGAAQIDHIFPKSKGYPGIASNGQVLCSTCNRSKSDKLTYHDLNTYYKNK